MVHNRNEYIFFRFRMLMAPIINREIHLIKRSLGLPEKTDFGIVETPIPSIGDGQILVKNLYFSVDPYMRGRMYDRKSYVPPFQLNQPLSGGCVGKIIESNLENFAVGEFVLGFDGWREYFISNGKELTKIDSKLAPIQSYLSVLGLTGFTAYIGLFEISKLQENDTVFVSAAAGAVGSIVCQIAKIKGCRVVGSAGTDEKIQWLLNDLGIDAAFNYKTTSNLRSVVGTLCPKGINVYFDNVGGKMLDAALLHMRSNGRVVICGMISQYNKPRPDPIYNIIMAIQKRLTIRGFIVTDYNGKMKEFLTEMGKWYLEGKIKQKESVVEGIENSVDAFLGLFSGKNIGKMLVKLD
jgi:NADPH-dependent curcumin reductase CurA